MKTPVPTRVQSLSRYLPPSNLSRSPNPACDSAPRSEDELSRQNPSRNQGRLVSCCSARNHLPTSHQVEQRLYEVREEQPDTCQCARLPSPQASLEVVHRQP